MAFEIGKSPISESNKRLVVIGGTGFVGRHLLKALQKNAQYDVIYAVHRSVPDWLKNETVERAQFDIENIQSIVDLLAGDCIVINLLRPDGQGWFTRAIENIVEACQIAKIRRYIHISSIDVYGSSHSKVITSNTPIKPITPYECEHAFAERHLKSINRDVEVIILRLGAIFGVGGLNLITLVKEVSAAPLWKLVLRRLLYGVRRMHFVSIEKVIETLLFMVCIEFSLHGKIFLVTDDDMPENNFAYIQDSLMQSFGRISMAHIPHVPSFILKALLKIRGVSNTNPLRRFEENELQTIGLKNSNDFPLRLSTYIAHLRENHEHFFS